MADKPSLPEGIRAETWVQRAERIMREAGPNAGADPRYSEQQNRNLRIINAQELASREMKDEIHLMLRILLLRVV